MGRVRGGLGGKKFQDCNMIVYNKNIIVTVFVIVWLQDERSIICGTSLFVFLCQFLSEVAARRPRVRAHVTAQMTVREQFTFLMLLIK